MGEAEASNSKKVTLRVDSLEQLLELEKAAHKRGLVAESIQDAGHTEIDPGTTTVLAVGPALNKDVDAVTGHLKPLPDKAKELERENKKLKDRLDRQQKELDAARQSAKEKQRNML